MLKTEYVGCTNRSPPSGDINDFRILYKGTEFQCHVPELKI